MKHVALTLLAVACGALSASAVDATSARIWLEKKIKPDFATIGGGIAQEKHGASPTYSRSWQYVSIPLNVEGAMKGDKGEFPHFIPELKVRISLAMKAADKDGRQKDDMELLSKEITYVDIPLVKGNKAGRGEGVVNVGVFISPSSAFKLSEKDGDLSKKLVAVAVEGTFQGASCNRAKEKPSEDVETDVILNDKEGKRLAANWWKKQGGGKVPVLSIAETPFAHDYARLGFPAVRPLYGAPSAAPAVESAGGLGSPAPTAGGPVAGGPVAGGPVSSPSASDSADEAPSAAADDTASRDKKSKKKKSRH